MKKELGKIDTVSFGLGGYQDCMLGIHFSFSFNGAGVCESKSAWDFNRIECTERCKWTEEDRSKEYSEVMRFISDLLKDSKKKSVRELVGVPVECTFNGGILKSWRVLTEVL
jgi:hypothetical protein